MGDVIKDYGVLGDTHVGIGPVGRGRLQTSVLLCRRNGQLKLFFRTTGSSPLNVSISYAMIDATPDALAKLAEVVNDAHAEATADRPHA